MNAEFIRFATNDNLLLQGIVYSPSQPTQHAYLHIHGMGGNFYENRFLDAMASHVTKEGIAFVSINTRGHDTISDFPIVGVTGSLKRIGNAFELFEECIFDIEAAVTFLQNSGYKNITLGGHSLGAVKTTYYVATTKDERIARLILMSPPDMISLAEADNTRAELLATATRMIKEGKSEELLPQKLWDEYYLSPKTYLNLFTRGLPVDVFNIYDPEKPSSLANIRIPTFAFLGEQDDAVTLPPMKALEIIKKKSASASQFDVTIIPGADHGYTGKEREMATVVVEWLRGYEQ